MNEFWPSDYQQHLFHEGTLYHSHRLFGVHVMEEHTKKHTRFCLWAPEAEKVRVVGTFNGWVGDGYDLQKVSNGGIWVMAAEGDLTGSVYKYEIFTKTGERKLKSDPFGFYHQLRPETASAVLPPEEYAWKDRRWLQKRKKKWKASKPMAIYEVHAGSWKKHHDGTFLNYKELADELIPYVLNHGFTHIELLPLTEHPLDESWGYQGTGYYSPTSRFGRPEDFKDFVDRCHQKGIGVILDWVPGHFCKDGHGLFELDGSHAYEYEDPRWRENTVWGTANFDLGKPEVISFLISNALYWIEEFHVDGFRLDAVANILFRANASREMNTEGVRFLKKLNQAIVQNDPSVMVIAEDSTDWEKVTSPVEHGGLGFTYKWNMGWMNDILHYIETEPGKRSGVHEKVTFSLLYAFSEHFVLPFSHDEVVHGKKSLLGKMPGDYSEKFAQLRLLLGLMMAHPGKKLVFMGTEFGQFSEWNDREQLDWGLLQYEKHANLNRYFKKLLKLYRRTKPFYELDDQAGGFEWIDVHNSEQAIFSFIRKGQKPGDIVIVVCNFTAKAYSRYRIGVPENRAYKEIFNSDLFKFGGNGHVNRQELPAEKISYHGKPFSIEITIPPFGFILFDPVSTNQEGVQA